MKYCTHCGKELLEEAVVCVGCGCAVNGIVKNKQSMSTFKRNKRQWIIVFSVLFVVFVSATIMLLTSSDFIKTSDFYTYLHSDMGKFGNNLSIDRQVQWQLEVEAARDKLIPYYVGIGLCGILALTSLIGDILLFVNKRKSN